MRKLILQTRLDNLNKRNISSSNCKVNNKMLNIHYIAQRNRSTKLKNKQSGGVRYIMHRLERVVARININQLESSDSITNSNTKVKVVIDSKVVKNVLSSS